jgi:hypothetical protein
MDLKVRCRAGQGVLVNSRFTLTYAVPRRPNPNTPPAPGLEKAAYLLLSDPAAPIGLTTTPWPAYQYNSTGAENTVVHTGTGRYTVTLPGLGTFLTAAPGQVHVTPYNEDDRLWCEVDNATSTGTAIRVDVVCTNGNLPWDAMFLLQYVERGNTLFASTDTHPTGYANVLCIATTCSVRHGFDNGVGGVTVTAVRDGEYLVRMGDVTSGGVPHVTVVARGVEGIRCNLRAAWSPGEGVRVLCFDRYHQRAQLAELWVGFAG